MSISFSKGNTQWIFGAKAPSITTCSIMALSIKGLYVMLSINDKEHKHNTAFALCSMSYSIYLSIVMLNVVMLRVVVPEILGTKYDNFGD